MRSAEVSIIQNDSSGSGWWQDRGEIRGLHGQMHGQLGCHEWKAFRGRDRRYREIPGEFESALQLSVS
jgi:hypothetical protein